MSDLQPFVHGQEGTHSACAERINKQGGQARCCYCEPHTPCTLTNPTPTMTEVRGHVERVQIVLDKYNGQDFGGAIRAEIAALNPEEEHRHE
jgi:hypothetical protein